MSVLIVTSIFAAQLSFHNTINRYTLSLSREGIFPRRSGRISPRYGTPSVAGMEQTVLSLVLVAGAAVLQLDPFTQFLIWANSPGVIGILLLQALTGIGVVVFFVRHKEHRPRWYVIPSAVAATLIMCLVTYLMADNVELITGLPSGDPINTALLVIAPAVFITGAILAAVLRRVNPGAYQRIGHAV